MDLRYLFRSTCAALFLSALFVTPSSATHLMGGELAYRCLGGNDYELTLVIYRDCFGIPVQQFYPVTASSASCGVQQQDTVVLVDTAVVTSGCAQYLSTCDGGTAPGMEVYLYRDTVTLSACTDWIISANSCCRNAAITNLDNPSAQSFYWEARLNNVDGPCNSSPIYQELQMPFICDSVNFCLDNGTFDIDGDSLIFSMQPVYDGDPMSPIAYVPGFSHTDPFPTATGHTFDPITGNHCAIPTGVGAYVVGYKIDEYRNGVWIGSTSREVQLWVSPCVSATLGFAGTVTDTTGAPVTTGNVELYEYGLNAMGSTIVGTTPLSATGTYSFSGLPNGQYIVRAIPDSGTYAGMAASYHESTYYWDYADVLGSICDSTLQADIQLVSTNNLNGTGLLSGYLGDLGIVRSSNGTPWPNVSIILEAWPQREIVAYTRTNATGHYTFSGVPNGQYRVIADHPGLPMLGFYSFTVNVNNQVIMGLDYAAEPGGFYPAPEAVGLQEYADLQVVIAPNPVGQESNITLLGLEDGLNVLTVLDMSGRTVQSTQVQVNAGRALLPLTDLPPGTYVVRVNDGPGGVRLVRR